MRVRIGMSMAPRELDIELEDADGFAADVERAIESGSGIVWVTDTQGKRHGLAAAKIAYVEIEGEKDRRGVGFST